MSVLLPTVMEVTRTGGGPYGSPSRASRQKGVTMQLSASLRLDHQLLAVEDEQEINCMLELVAPPAPERTRAMRSRRFKEPPA